MKPVSGDERERRTGAGPVTEADGEDLRAALAVSRPLDLADQFRELLGLKWTE